MQQFLLLFRNASAENAYIATTQDTAEDMPRWQSWIGNIAMQGKLITTAPIEYLSKKVTQSDVQEGPHKENNSVLVSGFLICKTDDINEVVEWSKACPILKYPMSSVEIRPLIPFLIN